MNESRFKCSAVRLLRQELDGAWVYHPSDKWVSGIPDLFVLWRGKFATIELKVGGNKPTKLQLITLDKLKAAGAITAVCYDLDQIRKVIQEVKHG